MQQENANCCLKIVGSFCVCWTHNEHFTANAWYLLQASSGMAFLEGKHILQHTPLLPFVLEKVDVLSDQRVQIDHWGLCCPFRLPLEFESLTWQRCEPALQY